MGTPFSSNLLRLYFRNLLQVVCILVLLSGVVMPVVQAEDKCEDPATATATGGGMSDCQRRIYQQGSYYFDVAAGAAASSCGEGEGGSVSGSNNAEKIWNKLKGYGLTSVAVAGIMGNWNEEATEALDPAIKEKYTTKAIPDNGDDVTGFGLAQWTSQGRQAGLFAKMREADLGKYYGAGWGDPEIDKDMPIEDIDSLISVEITYAWEGDTTKIKDIADQLNKATTTAGDNGSTVLFHKLFERSGDNASQIKERVTEAGKYLNQFGDSGGVAGDSCAGELGGVAAMDDAVAWAMRFIQDTKTEYNGAALATATLLKNPQQTPGSGGTIMSLATFPEASTNFICWGAYGCDECTTLSGWFVTKMTSYTYGGGDGGEVVGNLAAKGVPTGSSPRPFSIFSYDTGEFGHTGLVLGTLGGGKVITLENNWPSDTLSVRQYDITGDYPGVKFAYVADKLKVTGLDQTNP